MARSGRRALAAAVVGVLGVAPAAMAATGTWNFNGSDDWSDTMRWTGGFPTAAGDTANITAGIDGTRTVTIDGLVASRTVGFLTIGDTNSSHSYVLAANNGGTLTFDTGSATNAALTQGANSNGDTISAPLILNNSLDLTNNRGDATLTISGGITAGPDAATRTIAILGTGTGGVSLSGVIGNGAGAGVVAINKVNATNTLTLSGANTFSGGVTTAGGQLNINNAGTGGTSSAVGTGLLTIGGGTIANTTADPITLSTNNAQAWTGNFTFAGSENLNVGTGAVTIDGNREVTVAATGGTTLTVGGTVGESGGARSLRTLNGASGVITGTFVLSGNNTAAGAYTGGTNIDGSLFRFNSANAIPTTGSIVIGTGGALSVSGAKTTIANWLADARLSNTSTGALSLPNSATPNTETIDLNALGFHGLSIGANVGGTATFNGTVTPGPNGYLFGGGGGTLNLTVANQIAGANNLTIGNGGGGTVVVSALNEYSGATTITPGATLQVGAGGTAGAIPNTTGITVNGTFAINRSDAISFSTPLTGPGRLVKQGTGTLTIPVAQGYTGPTTVANGTLVLGNANAISGAALTMGNGVNPGTVGTLDLGGFSKTVASLTASHGNANPSVITVAPGQTLTVAGDVFVGVNGTSTTRLNVTGGGTLHVNNPAPNGMIEIGGTTGTAANNAILDLTGLGSVTIALNVTSGAVVIANQSGTNVAGAQASMLLPTTGAGNSTITASALHIGNSAQNNAGPDQVNRLVLGTGLTTLNVDTVNIGTGTRDAGAITFAQAGAGTLRIRNAANTGAADFNMGTGTANTGVGASNTFDVRGHDANIEFDAVNIGTQPRSQQLTNLFAFDEGTLTMASLTMSTKGTGGSTTNGGNRITDSTMELAGGTVNITNGVLRLGRVTSTTGNNAAGNFNARGVINVSGDAVVTIGDTGGTSINMAGVTVANQSASGTINLTGGTTSVSGDIIKEGVGTQVGSTATATVTLDGGALDMNGQNIGGAVAIDNLNFRSGVLEAVGQINDGATGLTKTAAVVGLTDILTLAGTNAYTGPTAVDAGTLLVNGSLTNTASVDVNGTSILGGAGTIRPTGAGAGNNVALAAGATLAPGASIGTLTIDGGATSATGALDLSSGAKLSFELNNAFAADRVALINGATDDVAFGNNTIDFTDLSGGSLANGAYTLFTADVAGAYSGLTIDGGGAVTGGLTIGAGLGAYPGSTLRVSGNDIVLNVVPEPATVSLFAVAAAALLGRRRRRRCPA